MTDDLEERLQALVLRWQNRAVDFMRDKGMEGYTTGAHIIGCASDLQWELDGEDTDDRGVIFKTKGDNHVGC